MTNCDCSLLIPDMQFAVTHRMNRLVRAEREGGTGPCTRFILNNLHACKHEMAKCEGRTKQHKCRMYCTTCSARPLAGK